MSAWACVKWDGSFVFCLCLCHDKRQPPCLCPLALSVILKNMTNRTDRSSKPKPPITVDAFALQDRDDFSPVGWLKVIAPAKVNLLLSIGERRPDGYHEATSIMHALTLHDTVFLRCAPDARTGGREVCVEKAQRKTPAPLRAPAVSQIRMVAGDPSIELPDLAPDDNIAAKAVARLAQAIGGVRTPLEIRIEKNIPVQAGLGGGSSNAAAALVGAACLWGVPSDDPRIEEIARGLGADVAFFLHGGCAILEGAGDEFSRALAPSRQAIALVKPAGGVNTADAYRAFDKDPSPAPASLVAQVADARTAQDVPLFNNLAPAAESLMPELAEIRTWLEAQPQVSAALLCGSGAATFALCDDLAAAMQVATAARARGWWSRATSFSPARALVALGETASSPSQAGREGQGGQAHTIQADAVTGAAGAVAGDAAAGASGAAAGTAKGANA